MRDSLLFSLDLRTDLAKDVVNSANKLSKNKTSIGHLRKQKFSDGEICVDFIDSVRGKRVYLLTSPNTSDEIMFLMSAIDSAKRAAASEIIPIIPYYPYSRSDKKDQARGPIGAKMIADILSSLGATSIITFDLHAEQIQGFFDIPVTHIEGKNVFDEYIASISNKNTVLCGPDAGSGKRVKRIRDQIYTKHGFLIPYVMMDKTRKEVNVVCEMEIIGDVKDKDVIIIDDIVDTAGTLCKAAEVLKEAGACSVRAIISHGILSGKAYENIGLSELTELVISDSLEKADPVWLCSREKYNEEVCLSIRLGSNKTNVISVSEQFGLAISAINDSLSYEVLKRNKIEKK